MTSRDRRPIVVLLVDDQPFIGTAVGRVLAGEEDMELHCCDRAAEAVERATQLAPTLILQDLVMPEIDGLRLLELYRESPTIAATPVVVLSGNDDPEGRSKALAAGASDYLVKLPPKHELVSCIRRHATGDNTPSAAPQARPEAPPADSVHTLDRETVSTLRQVGPPNSDGFFAGLVDQFLKEAGTRVNTLKRAAFGRNANELKSTAHALKGAANTMGASRLAVMCSQLEEHVERHPDCAGVLELAASVGEELQRVREAFAAEMHKAV
jgi:CheY-like chemotaxis protein/HPt (histidine-containing phosphotransfer) domain-containing protein